MSVRKSLVEVVSKFRSVHGDRYDYSKVVYESGKTKVEIVCHQHGSFLMTPSSHISGSNCIKCRAGNSKLQKTDAQFLQECEEKFAGKFSYLSSYQPNDTGKVWVVCPDHGEFKILCRVHLHSKYGCPACASEQMDRGVGSLGGINAKVAERNKALNYYVYLLKLQGGEEVFFKVGLTKVGSHERRMRGLRKYYDVEVLDMTEYTLDLAFELEQFVLSTCSRYKPLVKFGGYTECFQSSFLQEIYQ